MYKSLIRPLLFMMDPERVHHLSFLALRLGLAFEPLARLFGAFYTWQSPQLERELFGLRFRNPLGLAAGFDKDALLADKWKYLGFGFVEVGTVTPRPQAGNPKKRLFRLPEDRAIINRMGFNNAGVEAMARRLAKIDKGDLIIGANIGKNKDTPNEKATEDYLICFERLFDLVDYFVVNVSSPNTPGLRELQEKEPLTRLLLSLQERNQARAHPKPLLLKVAPDLTPSQLDDIIEVCQAAQLSGLILNNTTIAREPLRTPADRVQAIGAGGLSGAPLTARSQEVLAYVAEKTEGKLPLIGVGGIMQPEDARDRLEAGASLIQVYTGFVYEGPAFAKQVCKFLSQGS
jgi:dihydroorotate dehydrogenase